MHMLMVAWPVVNTSVDCLCLMLQLKPGGDVLEHLYHMTKCIQSVNRLLLCRGSIMKFPQALQPSCLCLLKAALTLRLVIRPYLGPIAWHVYRGRFEMDNQFPVVS